MSGLRDLPWMRPSQDIETEAAQAVEEGRDVPGLAARAAAVRALPEGPGKEARAAALYDEVQNAPLRAGYPYAEPDAYPGVLAACGPPAADLASPGEGEPAGPVNGAGLDEAVLGGWLGRAAGCMLGAPVEGWRRPALQGFLKDTGNWPVRGYLSSNVGDALRAKYNVTDGPGGYGNPTKSWFNLLPGYAPEDDDTNYTILALLAMEKHGHALATEDVARLWLETLPLLRACTAERAACRNLAQAVFPPRTATHRNPYREWIGAQIRADLYGYVCPGRPRLAAKLAYRDAALSHVKNGVYGAMWAAALVALAFTGRGMPALVAASLAEIPQKSRLREGLADTLALYRAGAPEERAFGLIHERYDENTGHGWCHAVPNAMVVAAALLYGGGDYTKTVGLAVSYGFDTDCNAATAGSVLGVALGAGGIPENWTAPLGGVIQSGLHGCSFVRISDLARRTAALARSLRP